MELNLKKQEVIMMNLILQFLKIKIEDIYGFEMSENFVLDVTDKILPVIEEWQNSSFSDIYPIVFINAIYFSVKENNIIKKLAGYVVLSINSEEKKKS